MLNARAKLWALCCRLLGLAPEAQGQIFDLYQAVLEASIQRARKEGKYDEGIVDVKGTAITLAQPPQVTPPPPPACSPRLFPNPLPISSLPLPDLYLNVHKLRFTCLFWAAYSRNTACMRYHLSFVAAVSK